jgi:membrane fusion protein (multidrug efflux system)
MRFNGMRFISREKSERRRFEHGHVPVGARNRLPGRFRRLIVSCCCALAACEGTPGADQAAGPPPVMVEVDTVLRESITDVVELVGQLEAEESVMIRPETDGTIESVEFLEGSHVTKGTLLFRLRDDEQAARLREAQAGLTMAQLDYERSKALRSRQTISQAELDHAQSNWLRAQAERDLAEVMLQRTEIRAPFDGVLGARLVSPGDRVDRETDLVPIASVDRLRLVFTVPETAVAVARPGVRVIAQVAPLPDQSFPGEVYFVAPSLDPRTRRLLLKAWIPNPDGKLRPGLFANIRVEIARHEGALTVPETAVAYDIQGSHVWRLDRDNQAERVPVEVGIRQGGRAEIVAGALAENDRIVSAGTHKVFPGAVISKVTAGAAPAS